MKNTMEKYEIINPKLRGWSDSKIQREFSVSRNAVRKYWRDYQTTTWYLVYILLTMN